MAHHSGACWIGRGGQGLPCAGQVLLTCWRSAPSNLSSIIDCRNANDALPLWFSDLGESDIEDTLAHLKCATHGFRTMEVRPDLLWLLHVVGRLIDYGIRLLQMRDGLMEALYLEAILLHLKGDISGRDEAAELFTECESGSIETWS